MSKLIDACKAPDTSLEVIQALLNDPETDINQPEDDGGGTALHLAISKDRTQVVEALLAHPLIDVNAGDDSQATPLRYAVSSPAAIMKLLLAHPNINVNARTEDGTTALQSAAKWNKSPDLIKLLLARAKIDVNSQHPSGNTLLHFAAENGQPEIIQALLDDPRISVNERNKAGSTPLHLAVKDRQIDAVKTLLADTRVDVNAMTTAGGTALSLALEKRSRAVINGVWHPVSDEERFTITKLLLRCPRTNVNEISSNKDSALMTVRRKTRDSERSLEFTTMIISHPTCDTNVLERDFQEWNENTRTLSTKELKDYRLTYYSTSLKRLDSAEFYKQERLPLITLLLCCQRANTKTTNGSLTGFIAWVTNHEYMRKDMAGYLHSTRAPGTAARPSYTFLTELVKVSTDCCKSVFTMAIKRGHDFLARELTAPKYQVRASTLNWAVAHAYHHESPCIAKILLTVPRIHTRPNNKESSNTPLHDAAQWNSMPARKSLLSLPDIDPNRTNNNGKTALHLDCRSNSREAVKEPLDSGKIKNPYKKDHDGNTALDRLCYFNPRPKQIETPTLPLHGLDIPPPQPFSSTGARVALGAGITASLLIGVAVTCGLIAAAVFTGVIIPIVLGLIVALFLGMATAVATGAGEEHFSLNPL